MKAIILCGGSGTRLWPLSRNKLPKQFLTLFDNKSLFQLTLERNKDLVSDFYVVINQEHFDIASKQAENFKVHWILEPIGKNTAPAITLASLLQSPEENILILPSDHLIKNVEAYKKAVLEAAQLANENKLVTFGIKPTYPEVGYGYIEFNGNLVKSFKEKPNLETAKKYLEDGHYLWNSGMFCFKTSVLQSEMSKYRNDIYESCLLASTKFKKLPNKILIDEELMKKIPSESIDYAVFEKSQLSAVIPVDIGWSDLGSFDSLAEHITNKKDQIININSENNFVISDKQIALIDVQNLIVIETSDCLLISKKNSSQKVRDVVQAIKESKNNHLLDSHKSQITAFGKKSSLDIAITKVEIDKNKTYIFISNHLKSITLTKGIAFIQIGETETILNQGDNISIPANINCKINNRSMEKIELVEIDFV